MAHPSIIEIFELGEFTSAAQLSIQGLADLAPWPITEDRLELLDPRANCHRAWLCESNRSGQYRSRKDPRDCSGIAAVKGVSNRLECRLRPDWIW